MFQFFGPMKKLTFMIFFHVSVEDMCHRYPNATAVNIYGAPAIHPLAMKAMSSLR